MTDTPDRAQRMYALLTEAFSPSKLEITDDSHLHAGHAGAMREGVNLGQTHFTVAIASDIFQGMSRVQCHQAIYRALDSELQSGLHALAIRVVDGRQLKEDKEV